MPGFFCAVLSVSSRPCVQTGSYNPAVNFLAMPMRILLWLFWTVVFLVLFWIALKNADPVTLKLSEQFSLTAPLILVVLMTFACGLLLGMLAASPQLFRQGREIKRLKRQVKDQAAATPAPGKPPSPDDPGALGSM
jgi:uncharacterized integral membrane protein